MDKKNTLKKKQSSFCTEIELAEDERGLLDYVTKKQQQILLKQQQEQERIRLLKQQEQERIRSLCTLTSENLRLYADQEQKTIRLYYKDTELTKGNGLCSTFCNAQGMYETKSAQWQSHKISENTLVLSLDYSPLPMREIWNLVFCESDVLEFTIDVEIQKSSALISHNVVLELDDIFKEWEAPHEKGKLLAHQYVDNISPIRLKDSKISQILLFPKKEQGMPPLFFESNLVSHARNFSICKRRDITQQYIYVHYASLIPKKKSPMRQEKHLNFSGRIMLNKNAKLKDKSLSRQIELSKENFRFIFDSGKGKIFWNNKELTTGLSVYTSVRSSAIWLDSYQAIWETQEKTKNKLLVSGQWPHIPISQIWRIELINKNRIFWQVDMEVYEATTIEIEQSNIMLSPEYKEWIVSKCTQGMFLDEHTENYDILPFRFWYGKTKRLEAHSAALPKVIYTSETKRNKLRAIVENTDSLYQARLLQYQNTHSGTLKPGRYSYFKGVIEIGT